MAQRGGVVTQISGGRARIRLEATVCAGCQGTCGLLGAARLLGGRRDIVSLSLAASAGLQAGDQVRLQSDDRHLLAATLTAYALPLASLLGGAAIGQAMAGGLADLSAAAGASLGLIASLALVRRVSRRSVPAIRVVRALGQPDPS